LRKKEKKKAIRKRRKCEADLLSGKPNKRKTADTEERGQTVKKRATDARKSGGSSNVAKVAEPCTRARRLLLNV